MYRVATTAFPSSDVFISPFSFVSSNSTLTFSTVPSLEPFCVLYIPSPFLCLSFPSLSSNSCIAASSHTVPFITLVSPSCTFTINDGAESVSSSNESLLVGSVVSGLESLSIPAYLLLNPSFEYVEYELISVTEFKVISSFNTAFIASFFNLYCI